MEHLLYSLSKDCPSLKFTSKFADIVALIDGNSVALRPVMDVTTRKNLATMPPPGNEVTLVVGGNGFIGAHLVARLSREPSIRKVLVTVRATVDYTPAQRLEQTLDCYRITDIDRSKISLVEATPTQPMLGLSRKAYRQMAEDVDLIFNCASSTDYGASYLELREHWVLSMLRILQFSIDSKHKHVTYLGSVGSYFYQVPSDFRRPDSWWYSGYCQMKWVNGELIRWLTCDEILSCTLCESPYVFGSTKVGLDPGIHYSWWRIIEIAKSIGMIWKGQGMNYVPVDVLVDVLTINAMLKKPLDRLLPCNPDPYDNQLLADLLGIKLVAWERFAEEAARTISRSRFGTILSSNIEELVRVSNKPAVVPEGYDNSWCDNHRLYTLYLSKLKFRNVRLRSHV